MTTWLDCCRDLGRHHGVDGALLDALAAFDRPWPRGGPPPGPEADWSGSFEELERASLTSLDPGDLTARFAQDVDERQAAMFVRRLQAVDGLLAERSGPGERLLRVGMHRRLRGILRAPGPRAARARALADFYYSLATRLRHEGPTRSWSEVAAGARWTSAGPGLEHALLDGVGPAGPLYANVLRVAPSVPLRVVDCHHDGGRPLEGFAAAAAVSGGFFLYSEPDIEPPAQRGDPVGLLVSDGEVLVPPLLRRGALLVAGQERVLRVVDAADCALRIGGQPTSLVALANRARPDLPPGADLHRIMGGEVRPGAHIPLAGAVVQLSPPRSGAARWSPPLLRPGLPATQAIAGGPMLRQGGRPTLDLRAEDFWGSAPPVTFSQDETGDRNLLPRLGVGRDLEGRLVFAAVDGRNPDRALGCTLADLGELLGALGCADALNLDGGSSKRMVIGGRAVDLSTTEVLRGSARDAPRRPVRTAILLGTASP